MFCSTSLSMSISDRTSPDRTRLFRTIGLTSLSVGRSVGRFVLNGENTRESRSSRMSFSRGSSSSSSTIPSVVEEWIHLVVGDLRLSDAHEMSKGISKASKDLLGRKEECSSVNPLDSNVTILLSLYLQISAALYSHHPDIEIDLFTFELLSCREEATSFQSHELLEEEQYDTHAIISTFFRSDRH